MGVVSSGGVDRVYEDWTVQVCSLVLFGLDLNRTRKPDESVDRPSKTFEMRSQQLLMIPHIAD